MRRPSKPSHPLARKLYYLPGLPPPKLFAIGNISIREKSLRCQNGKSGSLRHYTESTSLLLMTEARLGKLQSPLFLKSMTLPASIPPSESPTARPHLGPSQCSLPSARCSPLHLQTLRRIPHVPAVFTAPFATSLSSSLLTAALTRNPSNHTPRSIWLVRHAFRSPCYSTALIERPMRGTWAETYVLDSLVDKRSPSPY